MQITNLRNSLILADKAILADSMLKRLVGLIGQRKLESGQALIVKPCRLIHMFFMRFPIDAVFCTATKRITHIEHSIKPWQISSYVPLAEFVIELPANSAKTYDLHIDDLLSISNSG